MSKLESTIVANNQTRDEMVEIVRRSEEALASRRI
jgi:hypothetical protein